MNWLFSTVNTLALIRSPRIQTTQTFADGVCVAQRNVFLMKLIHFLIIPQLFRYSESAATPMYIYIKELCPPGLMPLTGARHVRTCDDRCPRGSSCVQGICCTHPPQCNHFTYKYECSLSPFGSRICCSLAECSSGGRARAICAAGCRQDEVCEEILDQRWCCPVAQKRCPANRRSASSTSVNVNRDNFRNSMDKCVSSCGSGTYEINEEKKPCGTAFEPTNGVACSPAAPNCDVGFECELSEGQQGHLCCETDEQEHITPIPRAKKFSSSTLKSTTALTIAPMLITLAPSPVTA
ncbi:unnamed protein product [Heligmosomoides polygyrus]|uniref:EB domain-containing protein n=1 Tax=Heligmosomoides polygyrus TaxID=6339 RepID=A0A3P8CRS7_HELPZ|nr:unnamed protein product [Heligmosomoides polygyrus]